MSLVSVFVLIGFLGFFFVLAPAAIYFFIKFGPKERFPDFIGFAGSPSAGASDPKDSGTEGAPYSSNGKPT